MKIQDGIYYRRITKKKKKVIFESWKGLEWETESLNKSLSWNMSLNTKGR